jgi:hypothetical protein
MNAAPRGHPHAAPRLVSTAGPLRAFSQSRSGRYEARDLVFSLCSVPSGLRKSP